MVWRVCSGGGAKGSGGCYEVAVQAISKALLLSSHNLARQRSGGAGDRGPAGCGRARAAWCLAGPPPVAAVASARARAGACSGGAWCVALRGYDQGNAAVWRVWRRAA
jgi:hypothetical protein